MAAKPLTTAAIAMTEKKMDMALGTDKFGSVGFNFFLGG